MGPVGDAVVAAVDDERFVVTGSESSRDGKARALWDEHYSPLAGWCAALVGDVDAAHEIAAEAFTRLLSRWSAVHDPRGFLYITALNLVRDSWRLRQRDARLLVRLQASPATSPEQPWLRDLVERLSEPTRAVVLLYYFADLPVAAVARLTRRPEGTVKRLLSEGRTQLRLEMED